MTFIFISFPFFGFETRVVMLICFFFHLVHIILYSWVGELKRRRKAIAVLYNKQDDATRDQLSSFSCLILFFAFFFLFCVYSWFSFLFLISIPTSHQMRFMIVMSHFFSLFNLLSLHYYSPLPDFLLLISVGRKKHLPWC